MSAEQDLSDEYVASLLKKDAETSSIKYSTLGLQAFLPQRPSAAAPKPNTRFLRNLLRETDSHNSALLAKEKREAKAKIGVGGEQDGKSTPRDRLSARERADSDRDQDRSHRRKRQRRSDSPEVSYRRPERSSRQSRTISHERPHRHERHHGERKSRRQEDSFDVVKCVRRMHHRRRGSTESEESRKESHERNGRHETGDLRSSRPRRSCSSSKPRQRLGRTVSSSGDEQPDEHYKRQRKRSRSRSGDRRHGSHRATRANTDSAVTHSKVGVNHGGRSGEKRQRTTESSVVHERWKHGQQRPTPASANATAEALDSDSDPLEAILGPAPPRPAPKIRTRGRGTFTAASGAIDKHFASSYDASIDVQPDPDTEDDWDQALEALRDRQRWKQQGAGRLRSAGFSEQELKRWEKGGEKDESDVRWAGKGEGREWDRGKVVDTDGSVELKAAWARTTTNENWGRLNNVED